MKSITMNQVEALNTDELSRKTVGIYRAIVNQLNAASSETPQTPDYREENLLDKNMGPEIRRMRW